MMRAEVTPNRRGLRSRELVLDAAERVMAEHGFEAATLAHLVDEAGIPMSSVYHYFGSKDGILLAVMQRGADRFFADLPPIERRVGPEKHLQAVVSATVSTLERHQSFLRLLIALAAQPPAGDDDGEIRAVIGGIRERALTRLREQLALAFGEQDSPVTDRLARFALAAIDGAFLASRTDGGMTLRELLEPLAPALIAARRALRAR